VTTQIKCQEIVKKWKPIFTVGKVQTQGHQVVDMMTSVLTISYLNGTDKQQLLKYIIQYRGGKPST
jgi:uncharacterized protein YbgA (DUF1722 family)